MKILSPILAGLFRSLASNARPEVTDPTVALNPLVMLTHDARLPLSIPQSTNQQDTRTSMSAYGTFALNVGDNTTKLIKLLEGVWEIDFIHMVICNGGAGDSTAFGQLSLIQDNVAPVADTTWIMSIVRAASNTNPMLVARKFIITVDAKTPVEISHFTETGLNTSNLQIFCSVIANRLL